MDILSALGVLLAISAVFVGNYLEGGHANSLIQSTAFLIVFGGTLGAILVQTPLPTFRSAMKMSVWVFFPPKHDLAGTIKKICHWSKIARRDGLLGMQTLVKREKDPFVRKALMLLIDGSEPEEIRKTLLVDIDSQANSQLGAARVFEGMGGYAPTIGIIGAVLGLIHVMNSLGDPSKLGAGIATAFVATVYGVGLANFFFLPMANKLKTIVEMSIQYRELVVDGIVAIADGENSKVIESQLSGYLHCI